MARKATVQHIRKTGAFSVADLAAGEVGVNTALPGVAFSPDGSAVVPLVSGSGINSIVALSQEAYDALDPPISSTLYLIVEDL